VRILSKKVCIAGSASLPQAIAEWKSYWEALPHHTVVAVPISISKRKFAKEYPHIHRNFFRALTQTRILFVANEDKKGIRGYIGAETFAELVFAMMQRFTGGRAIRIILAKMPSKKVPSYEEIKLWLKLGWIELFKK
jgi:hypothetical protein